MQTKLTKKDEKLCFCRSDVKDTSDFKLDKHRCSKLDTSYHIFGS
jgi:hypothetical protein